ncbi:hypothetical protein ALCH109712_03980 [Alkalicoccus chagannorensis]
MFLFLVLLAACDEPPELTMETEEEAATGMLGSYSWSYWGGSTNASGPPPDETITIMDMEALSTEAGETVSYTFGDGSNPEVEAQLWESEGPVEALGTDNGEIQMPEEPGLYPIGVTANWPDSSNRAMYTFLVDVE